MSQDIADQLRNAINNSGLSIHQLARDLDIPQPVLSRFASGQRMVRLETAAKIAEHFGMRLTKPKRPKAD